MQTLCIFCLLWSALVLAIATEESTSPEVPNEYQCPTCVNLTVDTCTDVPAPCHGEEKFCVNSTGNITDKDNVVTPFVTKGCVTELVLSALVGAKNVKPGSTYKINDATFVEASVGIQSSEAPTTAPTNTTTNTTTAIVEPTSPNDSPHISSGLFFALWFPSMSWVLLTMLLS